MSDGINIGDAVMTFVADSQQLDAAFDKAQAGAQATAGKVNTAMSEVATASDAAAESISGVGAAGQAAGTQVAEGMTKAKFSIGEARGEAALLGEAFDIHLPRHVRSFVAELPGVGEALSAAFAATAVLFLVEALVKGTEKIVDFINEMYVFTESMKESDASIKEGNRSLAQHAEELAKLKKAYEMLGLEGIARTRKELADLQKTLDEGHKSFDQAKADLDDLTRHQLTFEARMQASQSVWRVAIDGLKSWVGAETSTTTAYYAALAKAQQDYIERAKQNEVTEQEIANKKKEAAQQQQKLDDQAGKLAEKVYFAMAKARADAGKIIDASAAESTKFLDYQLSAQLKAEEKQSAEQIKLIKDRLLAYAAELTEEETALEGSTERKAAKLKLQYQTGKIAGTQYLAEVKKLYNEELAELVKLINAKEALLNKDDAKELAEFRRLEDQKQKLAEQTAQKISEAAKKEASIQEQAQKAFSNAFAESVTAVATGAETIGQALDKIAAATIQSVAQIAGTKGAEQLAMALGMVFENPAGAAPHFEAAALWFALDAAGSLAASAVGGGAGGAYGSGGSRTQPGNIPMSSSAGGGNVGGGPAGGNRVNVQHFASGGLVTGPTLAMIGDSYNKSAGGTEAVLPLDDERTMSKISSKLGGGTTFNVTVKGGMVSPDNIGKLMKVMSKRVRAGQSNFTSSNSLRITKRSQ
jgi:hypothetical protein